MTRIFNRRFLLGSLLTFGLCHSACGGDGPLEAELTPGKSDLVGSVCEMILSGDLTDQEKLKNLSPDALGDLFSKIMKDYKTGSVEESLKLGACVGSYFSIWANLSTLKYSLSLGDGAQIENFSFFLAYGYMDDFVEAREETQLLREILSEDTAQRPQIFDSTFSGTPRHYIVHGPCPIPYSKDLPAIFTRMMLSSDELVEHLFQRLPTTAEDLTDYQRFQAKIALVPISNVNPEYADCRDQGHD